MTDCIDAGKLSFEKMNADFQLADGKIVEPLATARCVLVKATQKVYYCNALVLSEQYVQVFRLLSTLTSK